MRLRMLTLMGTLGLCACGESEPAEGSGGDGAAAADLAGLLLAAEPEGARDVKAVKDGAEVGGEVVVYGRLKDFGRGYATFVLTDKAMRHCAEIPGDTCPTPWDYCCEDPEDVAAHSLTVEFRDGERPVRQNLEGVGGLKLLSDVIVTGTVAFVDGGNVIVTAAGFYVRS